MRSSTESTPVSFGVLKQSITMAAVLLSTAFVSGAPVKADRLSQNESISKPVVDFTRTLEQQRKRTYSLQKASFMRRAYMRLRDIANLEQAKLARAVLDNLESVVDQKENDHLPSIHLAVVESTSTILIEWILPTSRLSFNIESDISDSGWAFVSKLGEIDFGDVEDADYDLLVRRSLEGFVTNNG